MAAYELVMPKMGESIIEATILNWVKEVGDEVEEDDTILEIATDKVDSEVPSPVKGKITKILYKVDDVVPVGETIAIIETEEEVGDADAFKEEAPSPTEEQKGQKEAKEQTESPAQKQEKPAAEKAPESQKDTNVELEARPGNSDSDRFYSPLVRKIAATEGISKAELDQVPGTGRNGRVTKKDILSYLETRDTKVETKDAQQAPTGSQKSQTPRAPSATDAPEVEVSGDDEVVEMDRMRKMIAEHMVRSKQTSPHVTSFVEVDVTNIVQWRNRVKKEFQKKYGTKITYTPIFIEALAKALRDFPGVNASVDGDKIIYKKHVNVGMAAAMPNGNLIVPVIRDADHLSLVGLAKNVNELAARARENKLSADEIQGGSFTLTNVGTFGNVMGTPIIFQPQVAIMAAGAIRKKPAVIETPQGDMIGVRHMMYLSHSYDHRVVDGMLGGSFVRKVADYLEDFDADREI